MISALASFIANHVNDRLGGISRIGVFVGAMLPTPIVAVVTLMNRSAWRNPFEVFLVSSIICGIVCAPLGGIVGQLIKTRSKKPAESRPRPRSNGLLHDIAAAIDARLGGISRKGTIIGTVIAVTIALVLTGMNWWNWQTPCASFVALAFLGFILLAPLGGIIGQVIANRGTERTARAASGDEPRSLPSFAPDAVLPAEADGKTIVAFLDEWVRLLEDRAYEQAHRMLGHWTPSGYTSDDVRDCIELYDEAAPGQRATLDASRERPQEKDVQVDVGDASPGEIVGDVWYELNVDHRESDLVATFLLVRCDDGLVVVLQDIHVP